MQAVVFRLLTTAGNSEYRTKEFLSGFFYNSRSWAINLRCLTLKIEFERPQIRVYSIEFVFNFRQFTSGRCALKTEEPIGANTKTCTQTVWQW